MCDHDAIRSKETIAAFTKELVKEIKMVAFGKPRIVRFGTGKAMGITLVQLIETSNISAHFAEESDDVYLDIFSCSPFEPKVAIAVFKKYFKPQTIIQRLVARQARGVKHTKHTNTLKMTRKQK